MTFSARSFSLSASARPRAASCMGPRPRGRVPLIGRVSTWPSGPRRRKRSGDALSTVTVVEVEIGGERARGSCGASRRYSSNGGSLSGAWKRWDRLAWKMSPATMYSRTRATASR